MDRETQSDVAYRLNQLLPYVEQNPPVEFDPAVADAMRDAIAEIVGLHVNAEIVYGLLWHDRPASARKQLLTILDKAGQARGIAAARATSNGQEGDLPKPVATAIKHLSDYETMMNAFAHSEDEAEIETIKIRAAALMLQRWAEGD